jgi:hypothetical protein
MILLDASMRMTLSLALVALLLVADRPVCGLPKQSRRASA